MQEKGIQRYGAKKESQAYVHRPLHKTKLKPAQQKHSCSRQANIYKKNIILRQTKEFLNANIKQVNFLDKLKYPILESILKVLEKRPAEGRLTATEKDFEKSGVLGLNAFQTSLTNKIRIGNHVIYASDVLAKKSAAQFSLYLNALF